MAVANSTKESGEAVSKELGIPRVLTNWRDLVALREIDAVFNGTQAPLHRDIVVAALEAGKHVFTMNPVAASSAEIRDILAAARHHPNQKTMVFPAFPLGPYMREDPIVRRLLAEGAVGRVIQANYYWHTPFLAVASYYEVLRSWLGDHTRILAIRKQFPSEGQRRLAANMVLAELASGAFATYSHSTVTAAGATQPRIEILGDKGTLVVHAERPGFGEVRGGPTIFLAKTEDKELRPVPIPGDLQAAWTDPRVIPVEEQFVALVREGKPPSPAIPSLEDGLKALEFAETFLASAQQGAWVELPKG